MDVSSKASESSANHDQLFRDCFASRQKLKDAHTELVSRHLSEFANQTNSEVQELSNDSSITFGSFATNLRQCAAKVTEVEFCLQKFPEKLASEFQQRLSPIESDFSAFRHLVQSLSQDVQSALLQVSALKTAVSALGEAGASASRSSPSTRLELLSEMNSV